MTDEIKICPLRVIANCTLPIEHDISEACKLAACAWYVEKYKRCAIADIALSLGELAESGGAI